MSSEDASGTTPTPNEPIPNGQPNPDAGNPFAAGYPADPGYPQAAGYQPQGSGGVPGYPPQAGFPTAPGYPPQAGYQPQGPGYPGAPGYQAAPGYPPMDPNAPAYATAYGPVVPLSPSDERLWATLAHVGQILFSFLPPLIIWLVFRDRSRFVDQHAKEALNFAITVVIAYIVGGILTLIVVGAFIALAAWVLTIVFGIMGAVAANKGQPYRYPISIRFIK